MGPAVDQFCDKLRDRLDAIEGGLKNVMANTQARSGTAEEAVRAKLAEVRSKLQAQKDRVEEARANLRARAQQKMSESRETVREWQARHEMRKLQARADRAEAYAADAVDFALAAMGEAEEAVLDAVVARLDADAAG